MSAPDSDDSEPKLRQRFLPDWCTALRPPIECVMLLKILTYPRNLPGRTLPVLPSGTHRGSVASPVEFYPVPTAMLRIYPLPAYRSKRALSRRRTTRTVP